MNQRSYAKAVAKRLTCSKARRDEFVRDLESDIASALAEGETWEQVERRMGDPRDVARDFNEDLSDRELSAGKKRKRNKVIGIVAGTAAAVAIILVAATWWVVPRMFPTGEVSGLDEKAVVDRAKEVVMLLNADDFEALRDISDETMSQVLSKEGIDQARTAIGDDWGAFVSFGKAYTTEIEQMGQTGVVVKIAASYENATVVYTISVDKDLRLMGLYLM